MIWMNKTRYILDQAIKATYQIATFSPAYFCEIL